ncbi:MAG: carbonic anhydrase [Gammaproteobacteria bacterium]
MRQTILALTCLASLGGLTDRSHAVEAAHWGYEGDTGPAAWGRLDPTWSLCGSGKNQSPIDIVDTIEADLPALEHYSRFRVRMILNTGESQQATSDTSAVLHLDGAAFSLVQMHFHAPSENRIDGRQFPLEAHLVHTDAAGNLAVLAVLFDAGAANAGLVDLGNAADGASAWPARAGEQSPMEVSISASDLLPAERAYFRFSGSLTTPPCTEGVRWLVLKTPAVASPAQIQTVATKIGLANNRPTQPHNGRPILR